MDHKRPERTIAALTAIVQTMLPELYWDAPGRGRRAFDAALDNDEPLALALALGPRDARAQSAAPGIDGRIAALPEPWRTRTRETLGTLGTRIEHTLAAARVRPGPC